MGELLHLALLFSANPNPYIPQTHFALLRAQLLSHV